MQKACTTETEYSRQIGLQETGGTTELIRYVQILACSEGEVMICQKRWQ